MGEFLAGPKTGSGGGDGNVCGAPHAEVETAVFGRGGDRFYRKPKHFFQRPRSVPAVRGSRVLSWTASARICCRCSSVRAGNNPLFLFLQSIFHSTPDG